MALRDCVPLRSNPKNHPKSEVVCSPPLPPSARLISSVSVGPQHLRSSPAVSLNFDTSISMRLITGVKCLHYPSNLSKRAALSSWDRLFSDVAAGETNSKPKRYKYPAVYEPFGPKAPPSEKVLQLADRIAALPPEELKQIGPTLHLRLNQPALHSISSQGFSFGVHSGASAKKDEEKKEEKTAFDVKLEKFDAAAKIKVIKEVRAFTNLGLKEAKDLVEKAPAILKQGVTKEEANDIIEKIKAAGGVAVME